MKITPEQQSKITQTTLSPHELNLLIREVKELRGSELKYDATARDGKIVDAYIADADFFKGVTTRGEHPYDSDITDDVDLHCTFFNQEIGLFDNEWVKWMQDAVAEAKTGVVIVPPPSFNTGMKCAFS